MIALSCDVLQKGCNPFIEQFFNLEQELQDYIDHKIQWSYDNTKRVLTHIQEISSHLPVELRKEVLLILSKYVLSTTKPKTKIQLLRQIHDILIVFRNHHDIQQESYSKAEFIKKLLQPQVIEIRKSGINSDAFIPYVCIHLNMLSVRMEDGFRRLWHLEILREIIKNQYPQLQFLEFHTNYVAPNQIHIQYLIITDDLYSNIIRSIESLEINTQTFEISAVFPFTDILYKFPIIIDYVHNFFVRKVVDFYQQHPELQNPLQTLQPRCIINDIVDTYFSSEFTDPIAKCYFRHRGLRISGKFWNQEDLANNIEYSLQNNLSLLL